MTNDDQSPAPNLTDLADGTLAGAEWEAWLAAHPEAAAEVAALRQIQTLLQQLRASTAEVPADFEARVLAQVHRNTALRELVNLNLIGSGRALLELLTLFFSFLPQNADRTAAPTTGNGS